MSLDDARQVWVDQWREKTCALGLFESPGEFAEKDGEPVPTHGLPEVNRRLFDILSQTTNQDIMDIETARARKDNNFVPVRLRKIIEQEESTLRFTPQLYNLVPMRTASLYR